MKRNLSFGLGVFLLTFAAVAGPSANTFSPELDGTVYVGKNSCSKGVLTVGSTCEGVMRFDVNGMENIESAKLRLYVTQHDESDICPIVLRQMADPLFLESEMSWTGLSHEFQTPWGVTPIMDATDRRVLAFLPQVSALNEWQEFDVTAAVKREAVRTGKLAFVVSSMGWSGVSESGTGFAGSSFEDPALRPQFVVTWPEGESRTDSNLTVCPCTDEFTAEKSGGTIRVDEFFIAGNGREAYFKFDLSKIVGAGNGRVRRALLKFAECPFDNPATDKAYILSHDDVNWSQETDYPAGARQKNLPNGTTSISVDVSKGVRFGGTWQKTGPNVGDITRLVQDALDKGRDKLTLSLVVRDSSAYYAIGASHRHETIPGPELRVNMQPADVDRAPSAWARRPQQTRATLSYAIINNWLDRKTSLNSVKDGNAEAQTGSSDQGSTKRILHTFLLADPKGLENAPYVYLRIRQSHSTCYGAMYLRLFGCATSKWNCENVAWDNLMNEFDSTVNNGSKIRRFDEVSTDYENHLSVLCYDIGTGKRAEGFQPYVEYDVTDMAHEAARKGQYLTFMLATSDNSGWVWYYTEKAEEANRPCLVYPTPNAFAEQISAGVGVSVTDGHKTAELSWTADPIAGTTYKIDRYDMKNDEWSLLAASVSEPSFVDKKARSDCDYQYRVTAVHPDGTTAVATFTNRIDNTVTIANVLDGFVQNGGEKENPTNWTKNMIVMRDGGGNNTWGTREGFVRFPLADVPSDTVKVTFRLKIVGLDQYGYDERLCFAVVPDVDKTDDDPPTWGMLLGSQVGSTPVSGDGLFYVRSLAHDQKPIEPFGMVEVDVTEQIRAAQEKGESHVFFHVWLNDNDCAMSMGFATRESPYVVDAAQLVCERKSWEPGGLLIIVR